MDGRPDDGLWTLPPRRPRRRRRRLRPLPLLAALAAGAVVVGSATALLDRHRDAPAALVLHRCLLADGLTGRCGTLLVPLDPRRASGRKLALRVAVLPATHRPRHGAVFYLEGGPGGAATQSALAVSELLGRLERSRDLVLVDQRGTGGSSALACPAPAAHAAVGPWLRRCLARRPEAPFLTSAAAAADLEAVRAALGYGRIDVFGASYGATLAQIYAHRYPGSVRTLVLDAATPLGVPVYAREPATAARALSIVLAECAAERRCARAYPRVRDELAAVLRGTPRLSPADVAGTLEALTRTLDGDAVIPHDVDRAARGDDRALVQDFLTYVGRGVDPRLRLAMAWEIQCAEPWARLAADPPAGYFAAAAARQAAILRGGCSAVPRGWVPAGSETPAPSRVPALVLAGSADPQAEPDPARWRALFPRGRVVVVPGGAHGVAGLGCIPMLVASFVERGGGDGLDTACARRPVAPQFELR